MPAKDHPVNGPTTRRGLSVRGAGLTHRGAVRDQNEDAILVDPSGRVWAVADGMGGHRLGGYASDRVIDALETIADSEEPAEALAARFAAADVLIAERGRREGAVIGATAVAAIIRRGRLTLAWAGDARAYLLRDGGLALLTRDHSLVQEWVDAGRLAPEAARGHPQANIVTRAVGAGAAPEFVALDLVVGDRLLLCSDGLTHVLPDDALAAALRDTRPGAAPGAGTPADAACARLVQQTLAAGAPDNVSVIVVDIGPG
ncbi:protein phosphatase [Paracoccus denitrificans]|uniref:Protein phosphatase 2C domain protein n=1 Tax=Paracoccus denitrificans (strain Pd 1222) TaxID=318586 RepID=A1B4V1_PARDP|nr:protein phosphatase 2C domain protein [Paracoccus denitrificans PD1222]SDI45915.1 protein phosphatase [Paracoccus denitrificans]SFR03299.1 protein phosphatase [Paracoccus denitrificans]